MGEPNHVQVLAVHQAVDVGQTFGSGVTSVGRNTAFQDGADVCEHLVQGKGLLVPSNCTLGVAIFEFPEMQIPDIGRLQICHLFGCLKLNICNGMFSITQ